MNFAQSIAKPQDGSETPLRSVQIDGQVVMKIVKHCTEQSPTLVTGQLLGLDIGATLEVTDCFPFPSRKPTAAAVEEEVDEDEGANYQLEMMRCLREINVDNNTVGWYQSTYLGSYYTEELIETFLAYRENIRRCVCIVHDPARSTHGAFGLKALRLTEHFMDIYKAGEFTFDKITDKSISWQEIVTEVPVKISNSALVSAVMGELTARGPASDVAGNVVQADLDRLSMSTNPFLEKSLEFLSECMDDLAAEQQKVGFYQRNLSRQQLQQAQWLQKRKQENAARRAAGQEELPEEEDPNNPAFKTLTEPSRLEGFLITNQVNQYCNQIQDFSQQSLHKLYLVSGAQGVAAVAPGVDSSA